MTISTLARGEVLGVNVDAFDCSGALLRKLAKGRSASKPAAVAELVRRAPGRAVKAEARKAVTVARKADAALLAQEEALFLAAEVTEEFRHTTAFTLGDIVRLSTPEFVDFWHAVLHTHEAAAL